MKIMIRQSYNLFPNFILYSKKLEFLFFLIRYHNKYFHRKNYLKIIINS